ncbi:MAG: Outer membrane protein assembly factor YaeT precursor [uncultured Sulfurovum sp.]|uniref:Outer membrane protein assembly factor BamA n=1 Tax=uncultured Sulfurovum sp. TaxID=269237 RepID=A0A6S6TFE7_9BACT|nr:MAG: Outer membrane protein assembly factor YaeT precursor [uncultured Sulfurovum sp.]
MKKLFTLSIGLSSILLSQNITSIQYNGLLHLSQDVATEISGIEVGEPFDINKIDASIKEFYRQGYFSDIVVSTTANGGLVYEFKEKSVISKLEMNGYSSSDEQEELFITMGLRKGDLYDSRKVESAKKKLTKQIEAEGYYDTVIEIDVEPKEESVALVFNVNKGEKIYIEKIEFAGAENLDTDDLEATLANKEEDFIGWFPGFNSGVARLDDLSLDGKRAQDVYMQNGYMDATVSDPLMRVDAGSYKAEVTYNISEGEQYRVANVGIHGLIDGLDSEELKSELKVLEGKVFNVAKLRKDQSYLQEQVANLGYAFARVNPNFKKNSQDKTVSIDYTIIPGDKVVINDVIISGNHTTKDRVIRRDIYLAPGDQFSSTDLKDSKNALGRRGYFEKVDIEKERVDAHSMNLLVKVKETATGSIQAGGGYGSYQGAMVSASLSDRNIMGSGINAGISFDLSKIAVNYSLSIQNPRIWDSDYSFGASVYQSEFEYTTYDQKSIGASVNIGKQLTRNLFGSLSYSFSENEATDANNSNSAFAEVDYGQFIFEPKDLNYAKSTFTLGLNYDSTDDFYVPREGFILGGSLGYSGIGGDQKFFDATGKFGAYYGLEDIIDYDLILRYKARAKVLKDEGNIAIPEKLFMGGIGSVRGFEPYSITPFSGPTTDRTLLGGTQRLINTVEASIPLSKAAKMRLAFFYDHGMIGRSATSLDEITKEGYGVALEWFSPMGPINLVFAKAVDPESYDQTASFEFTMGQKF